MATPDTRHVQRRHAGGHVTQGLQQNGRLTDTGVAADQHHRAIHQAATEHSIQFAGGGGEAWQFFDADFGQGFELCLLSGPAGAPAGWRGSAAFYNGFDQGVPNATLAALPGPFGKGSAALGAAVYALWLGHVNSTEKPR